MTGVIKFTPHGVTTKIDPGGGVVPNGYRRHKQFAEKNGRLRHEWGVNARLIVSEKQTGKRGTTIPYRPRRYRTDTPGSPGRRRVLNEEAEIQVYESTLPTSIPQ